MDADLPLELCATLDMLTGMFRGQARVILADAYELGRKHERTLVDLQAEIAPNAIPPVPATLTIKLTTEELEVPESDPITFTPMIQPTPPEPAGEPEPEPELVDCSTLAPLTKNQFEVFSVIVAAKGQWLSFKEIDVRAGKSGACQNLYPLENKGYIRGVDLPYEGSCRRRRTYVVACFGAPTVLDDSFAHRGKKWESPSTDKPAIERQIAPIMRAAAAPPPRAKIPERRPLPMKSPERLAQEAGTSALTAELLGRDGNGGAPRPGAKPSAIVVTTYLIRRGFSCNKMRGGWSVDGKFCSAWEVLEIINEHRRRAELPPAVEQDLE